jgi:hypothetical protein
MVGAVLVDGIPIEGRVFEQRASRRSMRSRTADALSFY